MLSVVQRVVFLLALPAYLAPAAMGAIGATFGLPHALCAALGCAVACVATTVAARSSTRGDDRRIGVGIAALVWIGAMAASFFQPFVIPSLGSVDAASHISLYAEYVQKTADTYGGFVAHYSLLWMLQNICGLTFESALAASVLVPTWICVASLVLVPLHWVRESRRATWAVFAYTAIAFVLFVGPILSYNIGEGFWAHLTSFGAWGLLALGATMLEAGLLRCAFVVAMAALMRWTYGLNVGDLLLLAALTVVNEARHVALGRWQRWRTPLLSGVVVALAFGAAAVFWRLHELILIPGGILKYSTLVLVHGHFAFLVAGAMALRVLSKTSRDLPGKWQLHSALFLAALTFVIFCTVYALSPGHEYYVFKYPVAGVFMCVLALPVLARIGLERLRDGESRVYGVLICLLVALAGGKYGKAFWKYSERFLVRFTAPETLTNALAPGIVPRVERIVADAGARYGAVLDPRWSVAHVTNVRLLFDSIGRDSIYASLALEEAGAAEPPKAWCYVWFERSPWPPSESVDATTRASLDALRKHAATRCDGETCSVCNP